MLLVITVLDQLELKNLSKLLKMENSAHLNTTVQLEPQLNYHVLLDIMTIEKDFLNVSSVLRDISVLEVLLNLKFVLPQCTVQPELQQELYVLMEPITQKMHLNL